MTLFRDNNKVICGVALKAPKSKKKIQKPKKLKRAFSVFPLLLWLSLPSLHTNRGFQEKGTHSYLCPQGQIDCLHWTSRYTLQVPFIWFQLYYKKGLLKYFIFKNVCNTFVVFYWLPNIQINIYNQCQLISKYLCMD